MVVLVAHIFGLDLVVCFGSHSAQTARFAKTVFRDYGRILAPVTYLENCWCHFYGTAFAYCVFHGYQNCLTDFTVRHHQHA
jgi:hypothetical protein